MARACFLIFWGENRSHHAPHESGRLMTVPLMVLAILSLSIGWIGSPAWSKDTNFESWTATHELEQTEYPFLAAGDHAAGSDPGDHADEGAGDHADEADDEHSLAPGVSASSPLAAEGGEGHGAAVLHGPPSFHADVAILALLVFLAAVGGAYAIYGRGKPDEDPTFNLGPVSTALVNKYWFDDLGYRFVVVPVRDRLSAAANWTNTYVIDAIVKGSGGAAKRLADSTYHTLDQKVIDGGVNGAAFSAAWWSEKLKRVQTGNVQRYAGALVAGVVVLVLVFAAS